MTRNNRLLLAPLSAALALALPQPARAADDFLELGLLPGGFSSAAIAVSGDGSTVVGQAGGDAGFRAFRWTAQDGMSALPTVDPAPGVDYSNYFARAYAVSYDGSVVVGSVSAPNPRVATAVAFRWTKEEGTVSLGWFADGSASYATGVSADGSIVVGMAGHGPVGSGGSGDYEAFRWTAEDGMVGLGVLEGRSESQAHDISADGTTIVGNSGCPNCNLGSPVLGEAFRWTQDGGMAGIGFLDGGNASAALAVSGDGSVIAGQANTAASGWLQAFRWSATDGMTGLGVLAGDMESTALDVSTDGSTIVGYSRGDRDGDYQWTQYAFRWTEATGMQYLGDWLADAGIVLPEGYDLSVATGTNEDGTVVVGWSETNGYESMGKAWLARVGYSGVGLLTDIEAFNAGLAQAGTLALRAGGDLSNLALGASQWRTLGAGGRDDAACLHAGADAAHYRDSGTHVESLEIGGCRTFGAVRVGLDLGKAQARQDLALEGDSDYDGQYFVADVSTMLGTRLEAGITAYRGRFDSEIHRKYANGGAVDVSTGAPDLESTAAQLRLALRSDGAGRFALTPFIAYRWSETAVDAYRETGGGFPAAYDAMEWDSKEVRAGIAGTLEMTPASRIRFTLEAAHRLDDTTGPVGGEVIDLFDFGYAGQDLERNWLHAAVGIEHRIGKRSMLGFSVGGAGDGGDPSLSGSLRYRLDL